MRKLSLTTCEAEVMNVVWSQPAVTVQDVVDAIPRPLAYTTVMTTMKILEDKGFIERGEKRGRAFVYRPLVTCESASRSTVREMANRFFDGSVKSMVLNMIKSEQIAAEDLAELRAAIDSLENTK
jgi:BlaI family penicillinase repressor